MFSPRSIKTILSILSFIVLPLALICASIMIPVRDTFIFFGEAAMILLIVILFLKPISVISGSLWLRRQLAYRRELGVAVFWLALFHSVMFISDRDLYEVSGFVGFDNYLLYGGLAMIGMTVLGITSNNYSFRKLGKNWKRIQYLAYPVLFLTLLHAAMAEGELAKFFVISSAYIILKVLEARRVRLR